MKITRRFTKPGQDVFEAVEWEKRRSRISDTDGKVVFEMRDAEVPKPWSQLATDIMVSRYFRRGEVPQYNDDGSPKLDDEGEQVTGPERSVRQVVNRLAGCWRHWGEKHGYFNSRIDAEAFHDELAHMLLHQIAAPNSPQWFNTGINWAYGISGPPQGHYVPDPETGEPRLAPDAFTHCQAHACFIQPVRDDLVNEGGIMDLWTREARLFKYGSGTGTNFSTLRGENEPLSGGGKSSGLMSFLRIGDRAAGAIKSGGTTRRAAKMVCLDADHPDIEAFVNWKVCEELKVAAMVEGMKHLSPDQQKLAKELGLELNYDFNGEAYYTVSGQNSNNSVRLPDSFLEALDADADWHLRRRTDGQIAKTIKARDLWERITFAAWRCADPGVQFDTTANSWHTCPASGRINASNPCVTGDTLVATSTGFRRIKDLVGKSAEVINGCGERAWVDRIFKTGRKPVYELKTKSGYGVKLTADHRVRTLNRGDVPAAELTVDDIVALERPGFGDDFVPEAFAELAGAAIGDGCVTHSSDQETLFVTFGESERALAHRMQSNIDECKRWLTTGDRRGLRQTNIISVQTGFQVRTAVSAILEMIQRYAVLDAGASSKAFRDAVFSLDRRSQAAILRGLYTADGTVANYGAKSQYISLDSTSLELLRQVQLLLLGFGIKSKIYENRRAIGQTTALLPDGKGGLREYEVKQSHSLRISRSSRVIFQKEIGFLEESSKSRKLAKLNEQVGTYRDQLVDQVMSLTPCGTEEVYDLTEPRSKHFVANGLVVHNCSEYTFLDNTACNLASINLMKFYDPESKTFDIDGFEHAIRLWTIVLEITVLMAAYPSKEVAEKSWRYRTLGLGYANLGAVLMQAGIPYDSDEGRAVCAVVTAILTGRAYAASAELARQLGPFAGFDENREPMLRVIRNHHRAASGAPRDSDEYEDLPIKPVPIDHELFREGRLGLANAHDLLVRAMLAWDEALLLGEKFGYRNAQTTAIAPTGTIGLLMDCDTTGVEPDFALTKFKKLAGGGYFKIANRSLRPALKTLGYHEKQVDEILAHVMGTLSLDVPMPEEVAGGARTIRDFLVDHGYTSEELVELENQLPTVFELGQAFRAWSMPPHVLEALGIDVDTARTEGPFDGLRALGLSHRQIQALDRAVCGTQTVEGAPHLEAEHLPVFDCASTCGRIGKRFIAAEGHIRMMAAAQPFISGAISKTVNLPADSTVENIADAYRLSWELGLKANALYRDGSKLSQPLAARSDRDADVAADPDQPALEEVLEEEAAPAAETEPAAAPERIVQRIVDRPLRRRLPDTRASITHRFNVSGHEGYLTVGLYENRSPGELFITMAKEGSTIGGLMDCLGTAISVAFQYGVPVESLVKKFAHQRFEPMGVTTNSDIPFAKSLVDYIFRWLGMEFVDGYREANAPKRLSDDGAAKRLKTAPATDERRLDPSASEPAAESRPPSNGARESDDEPAAAANQRSATALDTEAKKLTTQAASDRGPFGAAEPARRIAAISAVDRSNAALMGDAPACDACGSITLRNGTCYKCLNCGNSMGCS